MSGLKRPGFCVYKKGGLVPIKKLMFVLCAAAGITLAAQEQPTPYDLIRPVWPLTWDSTVFDNYFVAGPKRNALPQNHTPLAYAPNEIIPDTLNQAFIDAMTIKISPIRVNQAGYRPQDINKRIYYVGTAKNFQIVNLKGEVIDTASFVETLAPSVSSGLSIRASNNAQNVTGGDTRYTTQNSGPTGPLQMGLLPDGLPENERLRIKVGNDYSSTFIISDHVYTMLRDALVKYFGVARSGNSESWFHPASHTLDGSLAGVDMTGGWYDCGDHLKESQTISYTLSQLALAAAAYEDRDVDHYAFNQNEIQTTDGIGDLLREAKFGAEYVLKAYDAAKGVISAMPVSVGHPNDHLWWGRPEYQDKTIEARGGAKNRILRSDDNPLDEGELKSNVSGKFAAGLAIVSKIYAPFDSAFAQKCLKVAKELYEYGKRVKDGAGTPFYVKGGNFHDELSFAAISLFYATADKTYLNEAVEDPSLAGGQTKQSFINSDKKGAGMFNGGWFCYKQASLLKNVSAADWDNLFNSALYAFYKLILSTQAKAESYGISNEQRMIYIEDIAFTMAANVAAIMAGGSATITLPAGQASWTGSTMHYDPVWGLTSASNTAQWWTKYEASNITELLSYYDVTKDLENVVMPQTNQVHDWKSEEVLDIALRHMDFMLGMNPWDVSLIYGVGDKNHAHPHHRGSNPEGKNLAGAYYPYRPPVGGLGPAVPPTGVDSLSIHFDHWQITENTCIDAVSNIIPSAVLLAKSEDLNRAPSMKVEIRHVSMDSAIVVVKLDLNGIVTIALDTADGVQNPAFVTTETASNMHEIVLHDLKPGTTYYFYAQGTNPRSGNASQKWLVDSLQTPFSFTTLNMVESADIQNVTVCNLSADTAEIMWYTPNGEYESRVYWDTVPHTNLNEFAYNSGTGNADLSGVPTKFHYVKIGGLKEKTTYYYAVESNGAYTTVDSAGSILKFTTPVTQYDFEVRMSQYIWAPMPALEINVINNEERPFDSLTVRLYMRATEDIYYDVGIRRDICQAYSEAGFNEKCSDETNAELDGLFRLTFPEKIPDTYDPSDGTWQWYFPIPLGSTMIKSTSRLRIDVLFDRRSEWEPHLDLMNDSPKKRFYCNDNGTWESQAGDHLQQNPGDWSWMPHSKANGDYADFEGIPCLPKNFGDDDLAPVNPYVSVYRKDEFVWGYSPSKSEMSTKKANYKIDVSYDAPFNVSDGSYVEIDQASKTVYVTGHARITEGGYITQIWANGSKLDAAYMFLDNESYLSYNGVIIAHYNLATDLWDLNIPVRMNVGSNKIDITVFAGPDPECAECSENGGCAFVNRNYYVRFNRPNMTEGVLTVKDANGGPVGTNGVVDPESRQTFFVHLNDKDKAKSASIITVKVINSKKQDTLKVVMESVGEGLFRSKDLITAVPVAKGSHGANEIAFFAGDTIYVEYQDPDDEEDFSRITAFFAESNYPTPQKVLAMDSDCDNKADKLVVYFSNVLDETFAFTQMKIFMDGMTDTALVSVPQPVTGLSEVTIPLDASLGFTATASPSGDAVVFLTNNGVTSEEKVKISDGIAPQLLSVTILENPGHSAEQDTVMIAFTEPVELQSLTAWPLEIVGAPAGASLNVVGKAVTTTNGKSWQYVITGNDNGAYIPVGGKAVVKSGFMVVDNGLNAVDPAAACTEVIVAETPKPVAVKLAEMRDFEGDGFADELYMLFEKRLRPKDMLDSFVVEWGMNSTIKSFITKADTSTGTIVPKNKSWAIRDSLSEPYEKWLDSVTKVIAVDTFSIVTIALTPSNGFDEGFTSGPYDGYGHVTPRLGPEGGFFDRFYFVVDRCPPVLMGGKADTTGSYTNLTVTASEPLTLLENEQLEYVERLRGGTQGVFLRSAIAAKQSGANQMYTYNSENDDAVQAGDSIRLPVLASRYKDVAGNLPTGQNPWRLVTGAVGKTKFAVTLDKSVTKASGDASAYGAFQPGADEYFRISALKDGREWLASMANNTVTFDGMSVDSLSYRHSGPVFKVDITLPTALMKDTANGGITDKYSVEVTFSIDVFDNLGQFINTQEINLDASTVRQVISPDGVIHLNLEWLAHDGEAPESKAGKKIATGAYISKFNFKARETNVKTQETTSTSDDTTKTFGFKRAKRK